MSIVWGATLIMRHLDSVGDGSGERDAVGDYSSTPTIFKIENYDESMDMALSSFNLYVQGEGEFLPSNYGGAPGLINGISIFIRRSTGDVDMTNGEPIVHTCCLARLFHEVHYNLDGWEPGVPSEKNWLSATWRFRKFGTPLILSYGDSLEINLSDDFTELEAHRFVVNGYWAYPKASEVSHIVYQA